MGVQNFKINTVWCVADEYDLNPSLLVVWQAVTQCVMLSNMPRSQPQHVNRKSSYILQAKCGTLMNTHLIWVLFWTKRLLQNSCQKLVSAFCDRKKLSEPSISIWYSFDPLQYPQNVAWNCFYCLNQYIVQTGIQDTSSRPTAHLDLWASANDPLKIYQNCNINDVPLSSLLTLFLFYKLSLHFLVINFCVLGLAISPAPVAFFKCFATTFHYSPVSFLYRFPYPILPKRLPSNRTPTQNLTSLSFKLSTKSLGWITAKGLMLLISYFSSLRKMS